MGATRSHGPRRRVGVAGALALIAIATLLAATARAADPSSPQAEPRTAFGAKSGAVKPLRPASNVKPGTLVVFNRPIFTFRASFIGNSPAQRAENVRERINGLLSHDGLGKVTIEEASQGAVVKIDGAYAFTVTEGDVDTSAGETPEGAARTAAKALEQAIDEVRESRSGQRLLRAGAWAAAATAVYVLALWLLVLVARVVTRRMLRFAADTAEHIRVGGAELLHRERMLRAVRLLLRAGFWAFVLLVTYQWLGFLLGLFPYTRPWAEQLNTYLADTLTNALVATASAIPDLIIVVAIFVLARLLSGVLGRFFDGVQAGRVQVGWIDADSARPTRRLFGIAVWVFALAMAYPYIPGSDSDAFKGLSVLIGLMVSVGASGIVGQAASGLILMYTRTFRPGEYIRVGENEGTVVYMGMFTSRVRTGLGEELTLPNSFILGAVIKNYSRAVDGAGFVLDTTVTIGYDAPWRQVHAMLVEAARRTAGVLVEPPPRVFQTALSDFYVEYRLACQATPTEPRPRAEILSALHQNVLDVFNEYGVQMLSPHYLGDPAREKVVPRAKWYAAPAEPPA